MNIALLLKWVWKLFQGDNALWAQIVRAKYATASDIFSGSGAGGSPFWKSLHKIKHFFRLGTKHLVRDGTRTMFWLDRWFGQRPLKDLFPTLFSICDNQQISVASACATSSGLRFRRAFGPQARDEWASLLPTLQETRLAPGADTITWILDPSGCYSVSSMYKKLSEGASVAHARDVWAAKLPLKIRIFTWQLILDRLHYGKNRFCCVPKIHGKGISEHGEAFAVSRRTAKTTRQKSARQRAFVVCIAAWNTAKGLPCASSPRTRQKIS
jgi:hypothetical protein